MDNKQKSKQILVFGIINQIVTLLLGVLLPKFLIGGFGSEVNGLLASVKQILVYVALLEAGVGTAALQALYGPFALNDHGKISEIMAATDRYFRRTGFWYGGCVLLLAILYPFIFHVELEYWKVAIIIILQGSAGVLRYLFQGKLTILLRVDGRGYITTNVQTLVTLLSYLAQIILILCGFDIISVQVAYFLTSLCQMLFITRYVKKKYPWLNLKATPDYKALAKSKFVIIHQLSALVFNNTDIILLAYFCDLKIVSVYAIYSMIFSSVGNVIDTVCSSVEFSMGQAFNSNLKRFERIQETYETYYLALSFALFTIALIMTPAFMGIYAGDFSDANYQDKYLPFLFCAVNILTYARRTSSQIINFAGAFKETQWRSILESLINVIVSVVLVQYIGVYGVLIGTIVALLYRTNDIIIFANCKILHRMPWQTYKRWSVNMVVMLFMVLLTYKFIPKVDSFFMWIVYAVLVSVIVLITFFVVDSLVDRKSLIALKEIRKR